MATANNSACGNLLNLSKTYFSNCRCDIEDIKRFVNDFLGLEDELCKVYEETNWKNFIEKGIRDINFQNEKLEMQLKFKELQLKIQSQENEIKERKKIRRKDIKKNHLFVLQLTKKHYEDEKKKLSKTSDYLRSRMTGLWDDEKKRYQEMEEIL